MKPVLLGLLCGLVLGGTGMWFLQRPAPAPSSEADPKSEGGSKVGVRLTQDRQHNAGIVVAKPEATELPPVIKAYGRALDVGGLAASLAEISSAQAALLASNQERDRQKLLGQDGAVRALESAEAALGRDRAALELAQSRMWAAWGPTLCARADLAQLSRDFLGRKAGLIRVELSPGENLEKASSTVNITSIVGEYSWTAELIGPAPNVDLQTQGAALFALIRGDSPVPGAQLVASLVGVGPTRRGFKVPRVSVIQYEDKHWVYVKVNAEQFVRKPADIWRWQAETAIIGADLTPETEIIVVGAQQLLSEELKSLSSPE